MSRAVILMDVDGVILPQAMRPKGAETVMVGHAWARADVVTWLRDLMGREDVTFYWCTTWEDEANTILAPALGLPKATPVMRDRTVAGWWKARQAIASAQGGQTVIWVDDSITGNAGEHERGHDLQGLPPTLHTISPDYREGLTPEHIQEIENLLRKEASA